MATVTKPIALDESLNTTELSSRNVADVLAQELSAVATAISGISAPSAEDVSYDNSGSELSATDVQNALDEIVSDIPTVNDGTLTIQQNGEAKGTFTANQSGNSTVNIETPTTDIQTAVDEFETYNGGLLSECIIELVPVQSGSGDPSPDNVRPILGHTEVDLYNVGKNLINWNFYPFDENKLEVTLNAGTYILSGKSTIVGGNAYIKGQKANGTYCTKAELGFPTWGNSSIPNVYYGGAADQTFTITIPEDGVRLEFGKLNNYGTVPAQLEKGSVVTDYEPYLGHLYQVQIGSTVYGGTVDLVSGVMNVDREFYTATWGQGSSGTVLGNNTRKVLPSLTSIPLNSDADSNIAPYLRNYSSDTPHFYVETSKQIYFILPNNTSDDTVIQICTYLATPFTIQLTPQQIETLAGQNNLSTPLDGQEITESKYKQMFTFDDVIAYIQSLS